MEKKTIGKFIAVLRKANGMTQKELGERLFVSDKTVSRWECDECTPELSLIPVIAEIFNITTDELLRGERNRAEETKAPEEESAKGERQLKTMLRIRWRKYQNLSLIAVGISLCGLLAAMICNFGFLRAIIGFYLGTAFFLASEICQICFLTNARIPLDEWDEGYAEKTAEANRKVIQTGIAVTVTNVCLLVFCLPLILLTRGESYWGVSSDSLFSYGLPFVALTLAICYIVYVLFLRDSIVRRERFVKDPRHTLEKRLLIKTLLVALSVALVLGIVSFVVQVLDANNVFEKQETFSTSQAFKEYMENSYDEWYAEATERYEDFYGDVLFSSPKVDMVLYDKYGNVIIEYYYNPHLYHDIVFSDTENKMPVTVVTKEAYYAEHNMMLDIQYILGVLVIADFLLSACVYFPKIYKVYHKTKGSASP